MGSCQSHKPQKRTNTLPVNNLPQISSKNKEKIEQTGNNLYQSQAKTTFLQIGMNGVQPNLRQCLSTQSSTQYKNLIKLGLFEEYSIINTKQLRIQIKVDRHIITLQHNKNGTLKRMEVVNKNGIQANLLINRIQKTILPNDFICSINEIYQDFRHFYLLQDHCDGGPIGRVCGKITSVQVTQIFTQILSAVETLHSINLFHGNLNLDSFHFTEGYNCKLIDVSCVFEKQQPSHQKNEVANSFLDIYQLGIIGYQLLEGCHPFNNHNQSSVIEFKENSCPKLTNIIRKMLDKETNISLFEVLLLLQDYQPSIFVSTNGKKLHYQLVILQFVLKQLHNGQEVNIYETLQQKDKKKEEISKEDFLELFDLLQNGDSQQLDQLFTKLDFENRGKINLEEFQDAFLDIIELDVDNCLNLLPNQSVLAPLQDIQNQLNCTLVNADGGFNQFLPSQQLQNLKLDFKLLISMIKHLI